MRFQKLIGLVILAFCAVAISSAQEPARSARPYDGIQAGYDAFQLGEERRQANIAQQLYLNDQLKYWSGIPTSRGETIYYGYGQQGYSSSGFYGNAVPVLPPANLEYTYAYGRWGARGRVRERVWFAGPRTVFEPWPYVPGNIWGYTYHSPMRQPIGQQQVQTGPNRWESHPVYDPPLPNYRPLPPVDPPLLDGTPYQTPRALVEVPAPSELPPEPPAPMPPAFSPVPSGPREY